MSRSTCVPLYPATDGRQTILLPIQETCWRQQVDTSEYNLYPEACKRGLRDSFTKMRYTNLLTYLLTYSSVRRYRSLRGALAAVKPRKCCLQMTSLQLSFETINNVAKPYAAFTPAQHVARQQVARTTSNMLRATSCLLLGNIINIHICHVCFTWLKVKWRTKTNTMNYALRT